MPDWIFFAEPSKQLELLKGEWLGDGCRVKQSRQEYLNITTTSKTLAFQLQSVYARLGIVATIDSEHSPNRLRSYHVNVFGRWAIKLAEMWNVEFDYRPTKHTDKFLIDERYVYMPIRRIEVEQVERPTRDGRDRRGRPYLRAPRAWPLATASTRVPSTRSS